MTEGITANPGETYQESKAQRCRRFRWLRRSLYGVAAMIVGVLLLRLAWGFLAQRELDNLIARCRAEGGPVTVEEFNAELDSVPKDENAAVLYEKAADAYVGTSQSGEHIDTFSIEPEKFTTHAQIADELMEANRDALVLIRQARDRPAAAFSNRLGSDKFDVFFYSKLRMLARVLWFAAKWHLLHDDPYEAVETLRDFAHFNEMLDSEPTLLSSLNAWATQSLAYSLIQSLEPASFDAGNSQESFKPASHEQIGSLIVVLADEDRLQGAAHRAILGSRAINLNHTAQSKYVDCLTTNAAPPIATPWFSESINYLMRPILVLDICRHARLDSAASTAIASGSWPGGMEELSNPEFKATLLVHLTHPITFNTNLGAAQRYRQNEIELYYTALAKRRMAVIALSLLIYESDHGERPKELIGLVPDYLKAIPRDPFSLDSQSFGYRPAASRPFLYSVGENGEDQGGEQVSHESGRFDRRESDIVFYLEPESCQSSGLKTHDEEEDVQDSEG